MSRLEKGILDKFFNGYLLNKRKLASPSKYMIPSNFHFSKFYDVIFFPSNKLEKFLSKTFEGMLPSIQYFIWRPQMEYARTSGWTVQDKLFHNFFRQKNIYYHAYAQAIHPWGYLDRQRSDMFMRRVETLLPGIEIPEWAHGNKRAPEIDIDSVQRLFDAYRLVDEESTPIPHYNTPNYASICHVFNQRYQAGYYAQRLFYNEEIRGDEFNVGKYNKADREFLDSWFANNSHNKRVSKFMTNTAEQNKEMMENASRWTKLLDQFFPEASKAPLESRNLIDKIDEPYMNRDYEHLRNALFIQKWIEVNQEKVFTKEEIQAVYEFFLQENTAAFWAKNEESGSFEPTELYKKFIAKMDFPDVFSLDKFTSTPPEQQFMHKLDLNWNINVVSVSNLKDILSKRLFDTQTENIKLTEKVRHLVANEIYNPLFRVKLSSKYGQFDLKHEQSYVLHALKNNVAIEELATLAENSKVEGTFADRDVRERFLQRIRDVVSTFRFQPYAGPSATA